MADTYLGKEVDVYIDSLTQNVIVSIYLTWLAGDTYCEYPLRQYTNVTLSSLQRIVDLLERDGINVEGLKEAKCFLKNSL